MHSGFRSASGQVARLVCLPLNVPEIRGARGPSRATGRSGTFSVVRCGLLAQITSFVCEAVAPRRQLGVSVRLWRVADNLFAYRPESCRSRMPLRVPSVCITLRLSPPALRPDCLATQSCWAASPSSLSAQGGPMSHMPGWTAKTDSTVVVRYAIGSGALGCAVHVG